MPFCYSNLKWFLVFPLGPLGVAFTSAMLNPRPTANGDWSFEKVFGDADFIAAGVLIIPPNGRKPSKGTKDNTYVRLPLH